MDYTNDSAFDLFQASIGKPAYPTQTPAEMWVEAENNVEVKKFLAKWFKKLEDGSALKARPDPLNKSWTMTRAKLLVEELDKDFEVESNRWEQLSVEAGPEFRRLTGGSLLAFAQEFDKVRKSYDQMKIETKNRLAAGEDFPDDTLFIPLRLRYGYCGKSCSTPTPDIWFKDGKIPDHGDHSKSIEEYQCEAETAARLREEERLRSYYDATATTNYDSSWSS